MDKAIYASTWDLVDEGRDQVIERIRALGLNSITLLASEPASSAYAATVRAVLNGPYRDRRQRLTTIALADRIWRGDAGADEQADAVYALAQFPRYQALLLTGNGANTDPACSKSPHHQLIRQAVELAQDATRPPRLEMLLDGIAAKAAPNSEQAASTSRARRSPSAGTSSAATRSPSVGPTRSTSACLSSSGGRSSRPRCR